MKHESIAFQEIFGASTVRESLGALTAYAKPEPHLPVIDDPFTEFSSETGGHHAERVADESFVKEISGCDCILGAAPRNPRPAPDSAPPVNPTSCSS